MSITEPPPIAKIPSQFKFLYCFTTSFIVSIDESGGISVNIPLIFNSPLSIASITI